MNLRSRGTAANSCVKLLYQSVHLRHRQRHVPGRRATVLPPETRQFAYLLSLSLHFNRAVGQHMNSCHVCKDTFRGTVIGTNKVELCHKVTGYFRNVLFLSYIVTRYMMTWKVTSYFRNVLFLSYIVTRFTMTWKVLCCALLIAIHTLIRIKKYVHILNKRTTSEKGSYRNPFNYEYI